MLFINTISNWRKNHKLQKILKKAYEDDEIIKKLSFVLGAQVYIDWVGRLYTVINPYLRFGKWDEAQVIEFTESGPNTTEHVRHWILSRLDAINRFIMSNNLFDVLIYDLKQLDDNGNYLLVMQPITLPPLLESLKKSAKTAIWALITGALALTGYFIFLY